MGKYFTVAVLESGRKGTIWFDELPEIGDEWTMFFWDAIGIMQNETGKIVALNVKP